MASNVLQLLMQAVPSSTINAWGGPVPWQFQQIDYAPTTIVSGVFSFTSTISTTQLGSKLGIPSTGTIDLIFLQAVAVSGNASYAVTFQPTSTTTWPISVADTGDGSVSGTTSCFVITNFPTGAAYDFRVLPLGGATQGKVNYVVAWH